MAVLTPAKVRARILDLPELNNLLMGELQNDDPFIMEIFESVVDLYNIVQPILGEATYAAFPSNGILFLGTVWKLCAGEAQRQLRNQVNYSAQGMNAGIDDKFQQYNQLAEQYRMQFMEATRAYKQSVNVAGAWGESFSPYAAIDSIAFRE